MEKERKVAVESCKPSLWWLSGESVRDDLNLCLKQLTLAPNDTHPQHFTF